MPDQKLLDYINQQLKNGASEEGVKKALADVGWQQSFIDEAFAAIGKKIAVPIPDAKVLAPSQAAEQVQPAQVQPQPIAQQLPVQQPAPQAAAKEAAKGSQDAEDMLPFKVQPVPSVVAAGALPATPAGQLQDPADPPAEKNDVPGPGGMLKTAEPVKTDSDSAFDRQVPQVSELDKAFGQTFGITPSQANLPADPKINLDLPAANVDLPAGVDGKKETAFVQPSDQAASLPSIGSNDGIAQAAALNGRSAPDLSGQSAAVPVKTSKKSDEKEMDELLDEAGGKPGKKSIFVFLIFGLIGLALIGGAAYAYFFYLEPGSASIGKKMAEATGSVRTAEFSGNAAISVPAAAESGETGPLEVALSITGVFDGANGADPVISMNIAETDNEMSASNSVKFETVSGGNAVYLKAGDFSGSSAGEIISYEGQWLKIDGTKIPEEFESVFPIYGKIKRAAEIGDVDLSQLVGILISAGKPDVVKLKDKLQEEQINGSDCRHYSIDVDKDKLKEEIAAVLANADPAEVDNYSRIIDKAAVSGEIWIGEQDFSIKKTAYSVSYDGSGESPAKIDLNIEVFGYNGDILVAVPDQYRLGTEIFNEVAAKKEALARNNLAEQNDGSRKSDMKLLFEAQKSWYLANKRFYSCSAAAGDCGGQSLNYPASIGNFLVSTPSDPEATGMVCGQDFVYCGLDNSKNPKSFCYYAKMSDGSFFTASPYGNFLRETAPATFKECQQGTLVE
ncbi:MAG TPA: hypothetical protein P5080_00475 [Candidatus Paceibacterota bacterium]|nr:hypothetical protein [Candidatus Pacearchaeota archaeon]HRZ50450.1 hypothetical protein [Candidatus Paceibacterota bacterium]HSA36171.1 hypothetical protein [Candidatus Paceibacterota bacterium]